MAFTETVIARCAPGAKSRAIDPSEGQLAYARSRAEGKQAQFRIADAQNLPFADHSYDKVATMALVIISCRTPRKAVAEMKRVVRPGGTVAAYMWDIPGGGIPLAPLLAAMQSLGVPTNSPNPEISRLESLRALWQQAGVARCRSARHPYPCCLPQFRRPVGFLHARHRACRQGAALTAARGAGNGACPLA